ncbi:DNA-3-methyladenine glycosylase I [Antarcticibacterium flavum]|uniref:DNA-3-methyladenine glycosylase I n=1 Tax=Antarcticibacterium flavum TaxID=2058175 RepID=A0A5B7X5D4_9FLAO|nr:MULTISPECIES: DNA-3-methyladenine glycosylase I [Antarcticibacterium]MCM4159516.1 DNA-3-methyladenine glycosylase I [Antarcticibacterium sp. W02-3]QCY69853.1 DNA-3-methyladenine glycosylase I [Antarcticibacterium flavum]
MEKKKRCGWCEGDDLYELYHDREWGVPVYDDENIFEFLVLETFQAGLSWITILRKRENFRRAFDDFDYRKIAGYSEDKIQELLGDAGIIRNKLKVRATVSNAAAFMKVQEEFGSFSKYIWGFVNHEPKQNQVVNYKEAPPTTPTSDRLSKDLKKRGFKFVGSTVIYAHMQATGMVNDHEISCFRYDEVQSLQGIKPGKGNR